MEKVQNPSISDCDTLYRLTNFNLSLLWTGAVYDSEGIWETASATLPEKLETPA
jgi:hypothetical protein